MRCHDWGKGVSWFIHRDGEAIALCARCIEKEWRKRGNMFGEPGDGTLFDPTAR
jgi:hypothetical protein